MLGLVRSEASDRLDEDERPLGEVSSLRYEEARTEVIPCPYADRRRGLPMNRSALRQISLVWPDVLATFRALARERPTLGQIWRLSLVGITAPLAAPDPVPRGLSALYKTSLGLSQVSTTLLLGADDLAELPFSELGDRDDLFAALDSNGWLLGQLQVCAGSRSMFDQMHEALLGRGSGGEALPIPEPDALADLASRAVAAHALWLLRADALRARGAQISLPKLPPWLRAVHAEPRAPEQVRRYFPGGALPEEIEAMARATAETPRELDALFLRTLDAIA